MSRNHNDTTFSPSGPPARNQRKLPVPPKNGPVLLPNLSPRPTLNVDELGSPEFRDALHAAQEHNLKSNDEANTPRIPSQLPSDTRLLGHTVLPLYTTQESDDDHTRRMQTRVAVCDNSKSPHHFQVVPLYDAKRLNVHVLPAISSRKSTCREKRKTLMALEPPWRCAGLAMTSVYPATEMNDSVGNRSCIPSPNASTHSSLDSHQPSHPGNSINNGQEPCTYEEPRMIKRRGCQESIAQSAAAKNPSSPVLGSPGSTYPHPGLYFKTRASSMSSLGSAHDFTSSSSLRDIQSRAASSTKSRRTQTKSIASPHPAGSMRTRGSVSGFETTDININATDATQEYIAKRRAIYTGSMYLDSSTTSDVAVLGLLSAEGEQNVHLVHSATPSISQFSVLSKTKDTRQGPRSPPQLHKDFRNRRTPLAPINLNVQSNFMTPSAASHASMPTSKFFVSDSSPFLSIDPFASTSTARRQIAYHPIVMELLAALDVEICEWNAI